VEVVGLYLVRDEADIMEVNLRHHLSSIIDRAVIVDNGSNDGTTGVLRRLGKRLPIRWTRDPGAFRQGEITSDLAREAGAAGADWVLPIDADEFWVGERAELANTTAGVLRVPVINFVQRRDVLHRSPRALLSMTRRPPAQVGPDNECERLVESAEIAFVEMLYTRKCIARPTAELAISRGNHGVVGGSGEEALAQTWACLHAPLRSRETLDQKARAAGRPDAGLKPGEAWHLHRWLAMSQDKEALDAEWEANSWEGDSLRLARGERSLVVDERLADAARPWVAERTSLREAFGRAMRPRPS
jgi:hypothetical protein